VALAPRPQTVGKGMVDTGSVFPFAVSGAIHIWLLTDNPMKAQACGTRLASWGLPIEPRLVMQPHCQGMIALDLRAKPAYEPALRKMAPRRISFGGDYLVLESTEPQDLVRFANWYDQKARAHVEAKRIADAKGPVTLDKLADAGEIESIGA
jgi:hypothetical protein